MIKHVVFFLAAAVAAITCDGCTKTVDKAESVFESPEHRVLYELMVERCNAINARDPQRLRNVYAKDSTEADWLIDNWLPDYIRYGITQRVSKMKRIGIVGEDGAGTFVIQLKGRLGRSPLGTVDVLYRKEDGEWKMVSVAER